MKGKNSFTVTIRLKDEVGLEIKRRAEVKGMTIGLYITDCINHSCADASVHTTEPEATGAENHSVHTTNFTRASELISPDRLKIAREALKQAELKAGGKKPYDPNTMNRTMDLPIYDATVHKKGDKVRVFKFGRWKAYTVPEIDNEGNVIGG